LKLIDSSPPHASRLNFTYSSRLTIKAAFASTSRLNRAMTAAETANDPLSPVQARPWMAAPRPAGGRLRAPSLPRAYTNPRA
jgi:hypothetical protein